MSKTAKDLRPIIKLVSTAGTGYTYVTRKNRRNTPDRPAHRAAHPRNGNVALLPDVVIKNSPMNTQVSSINLDVPIEPFELGLCVQRKSLELPLVRAFWETLQG